MKVKYLQLLICQFVSKLDPKKRIKVIKVGWKVDLDHYTGLLMEKILLLRMEEELTIKINLNLIVDNRNNQDNVEKLKCIF